MSDILWLMQKTLRTTFRSKSNIILFLFTPVIGILIALIAYSGEDHDMTFGVVNHDSKPVAKETISFLEGLDHIEVEQMQDDDITEKVTTGKVDGVITFGRGYSESVLAGKPDHIDLTTIRGESVTGLVKSYLYQYIDNVSAIGKASGGDPDTFANIYENYRQSDFQMTTTMVEDASAGKTMTLSALGFLIMIMMMSAANLSEIILKEKEERTYFRLLSTPITARKYILSNLMVNVMVMLVQVILTLVLLVYVFQIDLNIPFWKAFAVMAIFALISVGVSLVMVSFSNSRGAFSALSNLVILPTVMLSGSFWPVEVMPESVQKISKFLPQRWTLDTLTQLQEGNGFGSLYLNLLILLAFATALFLAAIYRFSHNKSTRSIV